MGENIHVADLTKIDRKAELYRRETYFRESAAAAGEVFGAGVEETLRDSALLMMKPDGLAAAKLPVVRAFLEEHGFRIVGVQPAKLDGMIWRELWRYQLTSATLDRLAVNEYLFTCGEALVLLLRSDPGYPEPATVRLSGLKGSATLSAQRPGTLRSRLGQPNRVLSFLHVADEPADLLRELGVLFAGRERIRAMRSLHRGSLDETGAQVLQRALRDSQSVALDLDVPAALDRLATAIEAGEVGAEPDNDLGLLRRNLEAMRGGERIDFRRLSAALRRREAKVDAWDLAVIATSFIVYDESGESKMIENPPPGAWVSVHDSSGRAGGYISSPQ